MGGDFSGIRVLHVQKVTAFVGIEGHDLILFVGGLGSSRSFDGFAQVMHTQPL